MSHTHRMYCCDRCSYAQYHPLSYCPRCPGKLVKRDVPHPYEFQTTAEQIAHLQAQGLDWQNEGVDIPDEVKLAAQIERARGYLARVEQDREDLGYESYNQLKKMWQDRIRELGG